MIVVSSLMLIALVLRVKGLGATDIWLDEANSWNVARLPWGAMMNNLRSSPLGPLYFVLLKFWMLLFGESEAALRAPSLIASVLTIPVAYAIGVRVFSHRAALLGTVLLTLSPLQLYFAQEARMYMPLTLFAALYFLAYLRWRDATSGPSALVWYAVAGTVMAYTNIISATLILALNIDAFWLLAQRWWGERKGESHDTAAVGGVPAGRAVIQWVVANAAITIAFLLYLLTVRFAAAGASQGWRGALGFADSLRALFQYPLVALHGVYYYSHDFAAAAAQLQRYPSGPAFRHFLELFLVQPLTLIVVVLVLGAGGVRMLRGSRRAVVLAVAVPLVIGTIVSVTQQLDLTRYFLFASPFLFLLLGYGLTRMASDAGIVPATVALAVLVLTTAFGIRSYRRIDARDSDYRPVARVLASDSMRASTILVQPPEAAEPLSYYLRNARTVPVRAVPARASIVDSLPDRPGERAWLVLDYRSPLYGDPPAALRDSVDARVLSDRYAAGAGGGVRLLLLETR
ncbi:MAG TPA: glycosyltransferase family 39 protein [Gemmatimonadaceae bacterium]|nr:glycosyltransferase family 39 protein [Gemmatimonadaceae bacterium]